MVALPSYKFLSITVSVLTLFDLIFYYHYGFWAEDEGAVMDFFSWFTFAALFFNWILTTNCIFSRSMAAYFVGLYLKLFSLAFEMITIGIQSENDENIVFTFITVIVLLLLEVVAFGLLLFIIDDENNKSKVSLPLFDVEGGYVQKFDEFNIKCKEILGFFLVFVPFYGPVIKLILKKKSK
eukprot:TRINITY_DN4035_c0_g1_i1.p1 TRINITY_DN4035_c0_g1~~TRINITY_DN4035_c0_g1_i1.p1  ORF type:complete len:181 (+),score=33.28 TRINITY_DN4035_c0_g1_i1:87-629(+)